MVNPFLTNDALKMFLGELEIEKEKREFLISKIPQMDEEERIKLFNVLKAVYLLEIEKQRAINRVRKYREIQS